MLWPNRIKRPTGPTGPTGTTGPTGATGPTGIAPTIDSILVDNDGSQTVAANSLVNLGTLINSTGISLIYTAPNTITINEPGTYFILYHTLISNTATLSGDVGASLLINGNIISNASEYVPATTTQTQIALQHNVTISEGFPVPITILNGSSVRNIYHDSSLFIMKLS